MLAVVEPSDWAVFTGAGISGAGPARLPLGNCLRNDVLSVLFAAVEDVMPGLVPPSLIAELTGSGRKLEVVVGRLVQTVGDDGSGCLFALRVDLPNAAHLLAALHLAHGGVHVTVNFDVGVELAYDLLTGRKALPAEAVATYGSHLAAWQRLLPPDPGRLRVVALKKEFDDWVADGQPACLLKLHGSLDRTQSALLDPVVVDIDELAQLTPGRAAAIRHLGCAELLLVTGYAGEDIDCYVPLLEHIGPGCDWRQKDDREGVRQAVTSRGGRFFHAAPDGWAVTGLAAVLELAEVPDWPEGPEGLDRYKRRFTGWATELRNQHATADIASAAAWLLADIGRHDFAVQVLRRTVASRSVGQNPPLTLPSL